MADVLDREITEDAAVTESGELAVTGKVKIKPRTKPLTEREEQHLFNMFSTVEHGERLILLEAFEGQAHKVAGFDNFEEYCRGRLGLTYSASYLSSIVKAAKFERQQTGVSFNALKLNEPIDTKRVKALPPLRQVLEITRVPDEKKWPEIYDEYSALRLSNEGEKMTADQMAAQLRSIVNREIKAADPDKPRAGRKPGKATVVDSTPVTGRTNGLAAATSGPSANLTPIVPPAYDGSEEQQAIESGQITYKEATERLVQAESFVVTFVALMSMETLNVEALNELYNDATAYQGKYGL